MAAYLLAIVRIDHHFWNKSIQMLTSSYDFFYKFVVKSFFIIPWNQLHVHTWYVNIMWWFILFLFYLLIYFPFRIAKDKMASSVVYMIISKGFSLPFTKVSRTWNYFKLTWLCQPINIPVNQIGPSMYLMMYIFQNSKTLPRQTLTLWTNILTNCLQLQGEHLLIHTLDSHLGVQELHTFTSIQKLLLCHPSAPVSLFQGCP